MVRAAVTLAAAHRHVEADCERCKGDVRVVGVLDVREARTMTALALHVVVALVAGRGPAACLHRDVAELVHRVTRLAHLERVTTSLQRCPGVRVRRLLPLPLESDVTVAADRERRLRVAHAHEVAVVRRQLTYDIAIPVHDPLIDTPRDGKRDDGRYDRSQPFSSVSSHGPPPVARRNLEQRTRTTTRRN